MLKDGGKLISTSANIKKIDAISQKVHLSNGTIIIIDDIIDILLE